MTVNTSARVALILCASAFTLAACLGGARGGSGAGGPAQLRNDQGWTPNEQYRWYRGSQGSRLIPRSWLDALEQPNSTEPLLSPQQIVRYGYLPAEPSDSSQLPIGFAIDRTKDKDLGFTKLRWYRAQREGEPWVGMNCSACHTTAFTHAGTTLRVDGGPTLADFQSFTNDLDEALRRTAADPARFDRFAAKVLAGHDSSADRALLRTALGAFNARQAELHRLNTPEIEYGNGRLDAVGHIFNRVSTLVQAPGQFGGPADAPVSYPFLWNINQHDFVQWNGIAPNKAARLPSGEIFDAGALVRNTTEVAGVFADISVTAPAKLSGFRSSVNVRNLDAMEDQLGRLTAPLWPAAFGALDPARVARGRQLFEQRNCTGCHAILARTDLKTPIKAAMTPVFGPGAVATDPWMACNAFTYQTKSGRLTGMRDAYLFGSERLKEVDFTRSVLVTTTVGTLFGKKRQIADTVARAAFGLPRRIEVEATATGTVGQKSPEERLRDCKVNRTDRLMAYKGRPLNGVWATAPYLHNGSVRTLYQLLLPPAQRETGFWVGDREFDPREVGFRNVKGTRGTLFQAARGGQPIRGNSNAGHDYDNASLSDDDRYALIEFMKSR